MLIYNRKNMITPKCRACSSTSNTFVAFGWIAQVRAVGSVTTTDTLNLVQWYCIITCWVTGRIRIPGSVRRTGDFWVARKIVTINAADRYGATVLEIGAVQWTTHWCWIGAHWNRHVSNMCVCVIYLQQMAYCLKLRMFSKCHTSTEHVSLTIAVWRLNYQGKIR